METEILQLKRINKHLVDENNRLKKSRGFFNFVKSIINDDGFFPLFVILGCFGLIVVMVLFVFSLMEGANYYYVRAQSACAPNRVESYSIIANTAICENNGKYTSATLK